MEAADEAGINRCNAWPELRKGGVGFGDLPPFLTWRGKEDGHNHLILVQPREVGALVPGAHIRPLPESWLGRLDLDALARPLARHPAFPGGASVHVVSIPGPGRARIRTFGDPADRLVSGMLARISGLDGWVIDRD